MAPIKGRLGHRRNGATKLRHGKQTRRGRQSFKGNRLGDEDASELTDDDVPSDEANSQKDEDSGHDSSSGDESAEPRPYSSLLQSFESAKSHSKRGKKRRKLEHRTETEEIIQETSGADDDVAEDSGADMADNMDVHADEVLEVENIDDHSKDPFMTHFAESDGNHSTATIKSVTENNWNRQNRDLATLGKLFVDFPSTAVSTKLMSDIDSTKPLILKNKLRSPAESVIPNFKDMEKVVAPYIFNYQDVLFGGRSVSNAKGLRQIYCLHVLNHILKTRDQVIKNNSKLARNEESEELDLRDQGFTRPKALMLLETRQSCARAVECILRLFGPEQQENRKRFQEAYMDTEEKFSDDRPADFRELFEGNDDNDFRLGIKFTRKTVKFFSKFYNSDIILASPLGLRRSIDSDPKKKDSDFLSSIEIVVVDQADAMLMQNWEHVEYVFSHLNLQPKDAHDCDFSRVRNWYLDGNAAYIRQNLVFSAFLTPELNSLYSQHFRNIAGKVKYQPDYSGTIANFGTPVKQTFSRFDSPAPTSDPESRFKYFKSTVIPLVSRVPKPPDGGKGILIFIPSYLDFVRIRNYFADSQETQNISFGAISEYTEAADMRRARSHFISGRHAVLLYTGRAHHFRRYNVKGVKRVFMYALPENPIFYEEIARDFIQSTLNEGKAEASELSIRIMISKWDGLKLERVVGSARVKTMLRDKAGDTFEFI